MLDRIQHISQIIRHSFNTLTKFALPPICTLCGFPAKQFNLCASCFRELPSLPHTCRQCGFFLPDRLETDLCGKCLHKPPAYDRTFVLYPYERPILDLIIELKFKHKLHHAKLFGEIITNAIPLWYAELPLPDVIIPIPMHPFRLKMRGFNQSLEIARYPSKALKIPLELTQVHRTKNTMPQSGLRSKERKRNISGAFDITGNFKNLNVAVFDDVITTGSTMQEFCRILKRSRPKSIHIWACARRS